MNAAAAGMRALVVEDEVPLAELVMSYLAREQFQVEHVSDGAEAVARARDFDPDVVILDVGLPHLDGVEVCRQLRQFSDCYVIMLTARGEEVDKLVGLAVGADDYLTKPFSPRELVARIKVLLRRPRRPVAESAADAASKSAAEAEVLLVGSLSIDRAAREVLLDGAAVPLTPTEFDVLTTLAMHPRQVLSRRQLIDAVWGTGWVGDERMVDVHIRNLRRKLNDDAGDPRFVRTIRGAGYRIGGGR